MVDPGSPAYLVVVSLLFVPWAYGVVSMVRDLKNRVVPALVRYGRHRREQKEERRKEKEREERERQLY